MTRVDREWCCLVDETCTCGNICSRVYASSAMCVFPQLCFRFARNALDFDEILYRTASVGCIEIAHICAGLQSAVCVHAIRSAMVLDDAVCVSICGTSVCADRIAGAAGAMRCVGVAELNTPNVRGTRVEGATINATLSSALFRSVVRVGASCISRKYGDVADNRTGGAALCDASCKKTPASTLVSIGAISIFFTTLRTCGDAFRDASVARTPVVVAVAACLD